MPTFPDLSSKMFVSPMNELLERKPAHFVSLPAVPPPNTWKVDPPIGAIAPDTLPVFVFAEGTRRKRKDAGGNVNGGISATVWFDPLRPPLSAVYEGA